MEALYPMCKYLINEATNCSIKYALSAYHDQCTFVFTWKVRFKFSVLERLEVADLLCGSQPVDHIPFSPHPGSTPQRASCDSVWIHRLQAAPRAVPSACNWLLLQVGGVHPWTWFVLPGDQGKQALKFPTRAVSH